jgi:hypothetical protein
MNPDRQNERFTQMAGQTPCKRFTTPVALVMSKRAMLPLPANA